MAKQPVRRRKYHLTVRPGTDLQGPSDEEIQSAVRKLPGKVPSFVVLQKRKCHFMQASGSFKKGFRLEYQEFSKDGHWEHVDSGRVDGDTVVRSLLWYAADDERWRTENQWRRYISPDDADDTDQADEPDEPDRPRKRDPLIRYIEGK